jgi:V-type H+-transporting ATPase subunit C
LDVTRLSYVLLSIDIGIFDIPAMKVGTLDTLMSLSDELARVQGYAEGVVRKVERQITEGFNASLAASNNSNSNSIQTFRVGSSSVNEYVRKFTWDSDKYSTKESLTNIMQRLVKEAEQIDNDMREVGAVYSEKKSALQALERKRSGNIMVCGLEEVITPQLVDKTGVEFQPADSEYFSTILLVISKVAEEEFLQVYEKLDGDSVPVGPESNRESVRGSPVVPASAKKLIEDKDGYVLYAVTILKKFTDSFKSACREKRFVIRDFQYDPLASKNSQDSYVKLEKDVAAALDQLKDKSSSNYGEAVSVWLHLTAVKIYVDSVLKYGLPVNFCAILLKLEKNGARKVLESLQTAWMEIGEASNNIQMINLAATKGDSMIIPGVSDGNETGNFPFVFIDLDVKDSTAAVSQSR